MICVLASTLIDTNMQLSALVHLAVLYVTPNITNSIKHYLPTSKIISNATFPKVNSLFPIVFRF